jgi:hypothetical protein
MFVQGFGHAGKISVIAKHDFLGDGIIQLDGAAIMAVHNPERIKRLTAHLLRFEEVVAPRLPAKVNGQFQPG